MPLDLDRLFTYHPPFGTQPARYVTLREQGKALADAIYRLCPESPERAIAITRVRAAIMWANAAIACNEREALQAAEAAIAIHEEPV